MVKAVFARNYITASIEKELREYGCVIAQIHHYDMIRQLLVKTEEQSTSSTMRQEDWIIEQYYKAFKAAVKGKVKQHLITAEGGTEVLQVLIDHEKYPLFDKMNEESIRKAYQRINSPTITKEN